MVKLTPELIQQSTQYINAIRDRELDLRGYKIPVIENLGATLDQFDVIDFSDNEIRKLDGFPLLKRIKCLLMNNNRIVRIGEELEQSLPNLESLILTNNSIQELGDLEPLSTFRYLQTLSLLGNPVTTKQHYRLYVIFLLPHLRLLDFKKVKQKERDSAKVLFKSRQGKEIQKEISKKARTFVPGAGLSEAIRQPVGGPSPEEVQAIKEAISKANSLEEIERLNHLLRSGHIPGRENSVRRAQKGIATVEEEEDDDEMMNGH